MRHSECGKICYVMDFDHHDACGLRYLSFYGYWYGCV